MMVGHPWLSIQRRRQGLPGAPAALWYLGRAQRAGQRFVAQDSDSLLAGIPSLGQCSNAGGVRARDVHFAVRLEERVAQRHGGLEDEVLELIGLEHAL